MAATETLVLTDFLLARIAEDEEMWTMAREGGMVITVNGQSAIPPQSWVETRLAECEAKRAVLKIHARLADSPDNQRYEYNHDSWMRDSCVGCNWGGPCDDYHVEHVNECPTLQALALPYADHPDYRQEWKP